MYKKIKLKGGNLALINFRPLEHLSRELFFPIFFLLFSSNHMVSALRKSGVRCILLKEKEQKDISVTSTSIQGSYRWKGDQKTSDLF